MKPNQLHAFVAVATQMSIRGAARQLGVSAPAVTKIIRELEREVGAPLVERSVKGIALTEYGAAMLPRARLLLDDMQRARDEIVQLRDGNFGHVRVAISTSFAQTVFVPAYRLLRERRPGVTVHVTESGLPGTLARLRDAQTDVAIMHVNPQSLADEFVSEPLAPVQLVLGVRNKHPLRNRRTVREFLDSEWVLPGDGNDPMSATQWLFGSFGLPVPARIVHGDSISTALALVAQLDHVGFFVEPLANEVFQRMGIRRVALDDPMPQLQMCAIQRRGSSLTPAATQFVDCVREVLATR
ncbi:LysR family transcriptional regulator [Burkholderia aenigmatica]|uniref:LysR family transcriptional regulator n=1 Tax=Burkholderia aenigmatica TaxID=2015348 RepID=A0A6J5IMG5_9BURK|nr:MULTISPECIES: LysR substrate-binding domain-containing protein [Burkholderia]AYQ43310.1 LysR family transcriptional regulator [Burkholderia lata]MCA8293381.1 LysR family transcriptional regulator [Burkholderia sp. AU30198]UKD15976.1 LysR substrate-binding domain-containing protein [Burkholderia aenigmatica]CAB3961464.1 LysR family transcriptional regulator [Burkholderia aenigmatica]VWC83869.1 LysR family transcriptional regulator [Burkholderia aenigmatica]